MVAQVGSSDPIRLDLHADPTLFSRGGSRERVAAKKCWPIVRRSQTQDDVLTGKSRGQGLTGGISHRQRDDVRGLMIDCGDRQRTKSWCNGMRCCCRREPRVACGSVRLAPQQSLERPPPSRRKRWDPQGVPQAVARMARRIEQRVDLCDRHSLSRLSHLHDIVASTDISFLQDSEIESWTSAGRQQRRHPRFIRPNANAIAGHARLSDLEHGAADLITVADTHVIVRQSFDREVLTELSVDEIAPFQMVLPVAVRVDLVDENSPLLPSMAVQVSLTISVQIQAVHPAAAVHGIFPDAGVHSAPLPRDISRKSNVHGKQSCHVMSRCWEPDVRDSSRAGGRELMDYLGQVKVATRSARGGRRNNPTLWPSI
ncbi:hypothetical protein BRAS3843_2490021 [Bradyrhizobium sp. STM 3843]|nr:hypothetical protein BRAS3843_2490021 [Bradyrhizobium sp. STM 3843]